MLRLEVSSGLRKTADGCIVARPARPLAQRRRRPRSRVSTTARPISSPNHRCRFTRFILIKPSSFCGREHGALLFISPKDSAQLRFGGLERFSPVSAQVLASSIDVESQHRHCRAEWRRLAPVAAIRRLFQGARYLGRVIARKDVWLKIKSVAVPCHFRRPSRGVLFLFCHRLYFRVTSQ
jgi:hypothetical protein